jgi:membrane protein required for colicin V production
MNGFDVVLLIFLFICLWRGFSAGLIKSIGAFLGIIGGAFVASHFYLLLFSYIQSWFGGYDNIGKVACFIAVFIIAFWAIHILFTLLDKTYDLLAIIPFMKSINHIAGGLLGLLVGAIILGLIIYVVAKYAPVGTMVGNWLTRSRIAPWLLAVAKILLPILSGSLKEIRSIL